MSRSDSTVSTQYSATEKSREANWELILAIAGGLLLWLSFPPAGWFFLAWPGIACWVWVATSDRTWSGRGYRALFLVAWVHWLLIIHWVRLPHWATSFGWLALSAYLATYTPLFVACVRQALRWKIPAIVAAPIVWCGLEVTRATAFTGFAIGMLGHTQAPWSALIQISDLCGAYTVGFVMVFVAALACNFVRLRLQHKQQAVWRGVQYPLIAFLLVAACCDYGSRKLGQLTPSDSQPLRVALIQGSIDTQFDGVDRTRETFEQYLGITQQAQREAGPFDLVVWPESMYAYPWVEFDDSSELPEDPKTNQPSTEELRRWQSNLSEQAKWVAQLVSAPLLVGTTRYEYSAGSMRRFNTALFIASDGNASSIYDKMHPVLFGEYIPLGNWFPWLYDLTPLDSGITAGLAPEVLKLNEVRLAPHICFENFVPHLIRRQFLELRDRGLEPDALVTLTNDGWFWGSSLLDIHLICARFRAVEMRCPLLIAANTGFSAEIDAGGRVVQKGPRRDKGFIAAEVFSKPPSRSVYLFCGDIPAFACAAVVLVLALAILRERWGIRRGSAVSS